MTARAILKHPASHQNMTQYLTRTKLPIASGEGVLVDIRSYLVGVVSGEE